MKQIASFSLGDLAMNSFNTQIQCEENFETTQDQILELMREASEVQDAQRLEKARETFFDGMFPEGHTDAAYDAHKNANVFGGLYL